MSELELQPELQFSVIQYKIGNSKKCLDASTNKIKKQIKHIQ